MSSSQHKKQTFLSLSDKQTFPQIPSASILENNLTARKYKTKKQLSTVSNYYVNPQKRNSSQREIKTHIKDHMLDSNLPGIKAKRTMKRGSYLEMWLDESLEPNIATNIGQTPNIEVEQTGVLRTLQRYQIDKKYLRSQNVPLQVIDKLYQTLYVYTHGINQTFQEVLNYGKHPQNGSGKMISNFWRAYTKLIQGCTSFQTTFQIVEQNYKRYILEMKQSFKKIQAQFLEQKIQFQSQITRLNKKINEQNYQYTKLTNDYSISQMTLQLTDQSFNKEVETRLKFQEKVNSMFTAYQQIREKYDKLRERLNSKDQESLWHKSAESQLHKDLQHATIENSELKRKMALIEQSLKQNESQIQLKRQEITQTKQRITALQFQKQYEMQKYKETLSKSVDYKQKYDQLANQIIIKDQIIKQNAYKYQQKQKMVAALRMSNQNVYQKYQKLNQLKSLLQSQKIRNLNSIEQKQKQNINLQQQLKHINKRNQQITQQSQNFSNKLKLAEDQIKIQKKCSSKNAQLISSLEAVKNKYEKLYNMNVKQKNKIEIEYNEYLSSKDAIQQQLSGMKMLIQSRNKEIQEGYARMENQKELIQKKIQGLRQEIQNKDKQILANYQKNIQDKEVNAIQVMQFQNLKEDYKSFKSDKLKTEAQNFYLRQKQAQMIKQRQHNRQVLQGLNNQIQDISKKKQIIVLSLNQKEYIINVSKQQTNLQTSQLRQLISQYREYRQQKACFIHPMLFQDQKEQINRYVISINQLKAEKQTFANKIAEIRNSLATSLDKIELLQLLMSQDKEKVYLYQQKIKQFEKQKIQTLNKSQQTKLNLECKIKSQQKQLSGLKKSQQSNKDQIQALKAQVKDQKQTIAQQQTKISNYKKAINQMIQDIQNKRLQIIQLRDELLLKKPDSRSSHQSHRNAAIKKISSRQSQRNSQAHYAIQKVKLQEIKEDSQFKMLKKAQQCGTNTQIKRYGDRTVQTSQQFSHKNKFLPTNSNNQICQYGCQVEMERQKQEGDRQNFEPIRAIRQQPKQFKKVEGSDYRRALKITYMRR